MCSAYSVYYEMYKYLQFEWNEIRANLLRIVNF